MAINEDINALIASGFTQDDLVNELRKRGYSGSEISNALSQLRIKEAVAGPQAPIPAGPQDSSFQAGSFSGSDYSSPYSSQSSGQVDSYSDAGLSSDTISEIAEQTVIDKLAPLRKKIEDVIDLKSSFEARLQFLEGRLKQVEKIIDRLQLSVLQKVGEYITNVDDIKKELVETNKTFKSITEHHHKR